MMDADSREDVAKKRAGAVWEQNGRPTETCWKSYRKRGKSGKKGNVGRWARMWPARQGLKQLGVAQRDEEAQVEARRKGVQ